MQLVQPQKEILVLWDFTKSVYCNITEVSTISYVQTWRSSSTLQF